ncbi:RING-H2 finger protein ATL52-like [Dendrobium catenatum]|uniref:RING-type E3 ubiquitin transferase n=1 Tax=Dendrobium catenatum TaxID=906689 RepID=A0A2I0W455_9ASPA|nr:RING-H2 finger protein ATL52-like [Dendrobium catenatum]XP_028554419.1 RING-H2 finger protein ATL52-like [Dendrobium catenatum]XP_028554420.1 RING-H2 finger protein ATL52-like [Dendrobium catenatum]XP_028554421.1 RING-H2 finger protein ATL52-like [Dendrobium catenatum]PKU70449.1 RING-H2 finger protein ATL54 [Dendrobium catenatum]
MALRRQILIFNKSENSSGCTHDCYAFPSPQHSLPSPLSSDDSSSGHHLIANVIIPIVSVASAIIFLVLTYYTVLARRRRCEGELPSVGNVGISESQEGEADYPVWRIRTVGLDESTINAISAKPYVSGVGTAADCSVCLGDFCEGELVRFLPACGHAFHVLCIDTWLRSHISCPLCRAKIIDSVVTVASEGDDFGSASRVLEELEEDEDMVVTDTALDCIESSTLRDRGGLPENVLGQEWMSNSMDSFRASDLSLRMDREGRSEDGVNLNRSKQGSSFSEESQQKKALDVGGGSNSASGRIFFFSRYGRSRSSSVLPV